MELACTFYRTRKSDRHCKVNGRVNEFSVHSAEEPRAHLPRELAKRVAAVFSDVLGADRVGDVTYSDTFIEIECAPRTPRKQIDRAMEILNQPLH